MKTTHYFGRRGKRIVIHFDEYIRDKQYQEAREAEALAEAYSVNGPFWFLEED